MPDASRQRCLGAFCLREERRIQLKSDWSEHTLMAESGRLCERHLSAKGGHWTGRRQNSSFLDDNYPARYIANSVLPQYFFVG